MHARGHGPAALIGTGSLRFAVLFRGPCEIFRAQIRWTCRRLKPLSVVLGAGPHLVSIPVETHFWMAALSLA